ncbi:MAG: hypothetical protein FWG22_06695, partial [Prolixibacteraceae bacterium]|nr:hypothetical protein [Prolixibacteraceae bacterium]
MKNKLSTKILAATLVLTLMLGITPGQLVWANDGTMPIVPTSGTITRVEWVRELVQLFDMTVEQDNMPDDYFL